jgi:RNA-binding protein
MELKGADRHALRALGHGLKPVVQIGKDGVSERLLAAIDEQLGASELIKVRVLETCPLDRHEAAEELAEKSGAAVAQVLGRTILLFRRHPEQPRIALPSHPLPRR